MMKKCNMLLAYIYIMTGLTACGVQQETASEEIELLEPISVSYVTEAATYRNLYDADVYDSAVLPYIEEYAFTDGGEVDNFTAYPGEAVQDGETLVYCSTEDIDEEIAELEEKIADMEEEYRRYQTKVTESLIEPKGEAERLEDIVEDYGEDEPEQYITDADGNRIVNPDYSGWLQQYNKFEGEYRTLSHSVTIQEAALRQRTELYELDHAYYLENLKELKEEREKYILQSGITGEVVAIGQTEYGTYNPKAEEAVIAIGDMSRKILKCNYVKKSIVTNAAEIYAVINGEKYALEYQPMDTKEYIRLTANGETVYSIFEIVGDAESVQAGDYAAVTIVNEKREQVLTVPKDAVRRDGSVQYVYVIVDGQSVRKDVETGLSDGVYTEILSGITEGEAVMVQNPLTHGNEEIVVGMGACSSIFWQTGFMYYPAITDVTNPVTYGTAYYVESNVSLYQYVEKGETIATIRTETDAVELQRKQLKLQRLMERLQDVIDEEDPEKNKEIIADKQEEIAELNQEITEMQRDGNTTRITAPESGIIVRLEMISKDEGLKKDALIAQIADANTCYVMVTNQNQQLQYGNEVTIIYNTYENKKKQEHNVTGTVASVSQMGVSTILQEEKSFILIPPEASSAMLAASAGEDNRMGYAAYRVTGDVQKMENVLVVPREAVTELAGRTYVHVIDETGEIKAQSFIAGGYDTDNYWVIEGLTEGMKLCLE